MDRKLIKSEAKEALNGKWLMFFLFLLVVGAISGISVGILGPVLGLGTFLVVSDLLEGKDLNANRYGEIFKDLNHLLKLIGVSLLSSLIITIGGVLFVIPGIIAALMLSQANFIMIEHPEIGIIDALKRSKDMMKGYKIDYIVFLLSYIGHALLTIITFGIYGAYFLPLLKVAQQNYYRHLKAIHDPHVIEAEIIN